MCAGRTHRLRNGSGRKPGCRHNRRGRLWRLVREFARLISGKKKMRPRGLTTRRVPLPLACQAIPRRSRVTPSPLGRRARRPPVSRRDGGATLAARLIRLGQASLYARQNKEGVPKDSLSHHFTDRLEGELYREFDLAHACGRTRRGIVFDVGNLAITGAVDTSTRTGLVRIEAHDWVIEHVE